MAHSATTRRQHILLLDTIVLGVVGALGAQNLRGAPPRLAEPLSHAPGGVCPPDLPSSGGTLEQVIGPHWLWLVPVATTLGGLIRDRRNATAVSAWETR